MEDFEKIGKLGDLELEDIDDMNLDEIDSLVEMDSAETTKDNHTLLSLQDVLS